MRIRSIRPEFWSSEDVAAMDWHTRLVYIGLWSYVDDNGVGRDLDRLIVADLFPLDEALPEASRRVTGALRHLSDHGQIVRYRVGGKPYLHIVAWEKHQRIEKRSTGRYPLPTTENAEVREPSPTTPVALPEGSPLGEGEKGRSGEGEKVSSSELRPDVEELCSLLAALVENNGSKRPTITKAWRTAARLMLDRDERPLDEARQLIRWSQGDSFWAGNVLSMPKFREQYDKLRLRSGIGARLAERVYVNEADYTGDPDDLPAYRAWYAAAAKGGQS